DDGAHETAGGRHDQEDEDEHVLHPAWTSSAPVRVRISRTEGPRSGAQWTVTPKRSLVKRGSNVVVGRTCGNRPRITMPRTVATPPKSTMSSKAMMTKGGIEEPLMSPGMHQAKMVGHRRYFPPVMRPQVSEVQIVIRNAEAMPARPPISVKRRTRLTGRSRSMTSSISCNGTGV